MRTGLTRFSHLACSAFVSVMIGSVTLPAVAGERNTFKAQTDPSIHLDKAEFKDWIGQQEQIAFAKLLANISPADAARGVVVASPQRKDPDYYFHWTRDAALVMDIVVREHTAEKPESRVRWRKMMTEFIQFSRANQLTGALTGLGEPKFHVDGSPYMAPWGRPQNDGPALRALTLTRFGMQLINEGEIDYVREHLYDNDIPAHTVLKADLEYTAHHWREASFDLWEEVKGDHFYTRLSQLVALREGAVLADKMGDGGAAAFYREQADQIEQSLNEFWNADAKFIGATRNRVDGIPYKESNIDMAVILGVLHAGFGSGAYSPADSRVMATAHKFEGAFRDLYPINSGDRFKDVGIAYGRYPEDLYSGTPNLNQGNPWILTTNAMAEYHFELVEQLKHAKDLTVDDTNIEFLKAASPSFAAIKKAGPGFIFKKGSKEMTNLLNDLKARGDMYLKRIRLHTMADGSMAEQLDENTGFQTSAHELTWSYASYITAVAARTKALK